MLVLKKAIENDFVNRWVDTPVWVYGYQFNATGLTEYIKVTNTPLDNDVTDTSGTCKRKEMFTEVFCYGATLNDATETADSVVAFLRSATTYDIRNNIVYDTNQLDNTLWYVTLRATAFHL